MTNGWNIDVPETDRHRMAWRPSKGDKTCTEKWGTTEPGIPCELRKGHDGNHVGTLPDTKGFRP